jgi:hypothetical protein
MVAIFLLNLCKTIGGDNWIDSVRESSARVHKSPFLAAAKAPEQEELVVSEGLNSSHEHRLIGTALCG